MRTHIRGAGLILGLAVTVFGGPVAWADNAESFQDPGNNAVTPFLHAPDEPLSPGQEIHIQGYCPDPEAGPLTSDALTGIEVLHDPRSGPPNLNASGVVAEASAPEATLSSPVLRTVTLVPDPEGHQPWALHGSTTVSEDAEPGAGDGQVSRVPRGAPETGDRAGRTGSGPQLSLSMLLFGLTVGAAAGAGAIAWRELRR